MATFGQRLKRLAKRHFRTQGELAGRLAVSETTVSMWVKDRARPDFDQIAAMMRLGINISWLITGEGEMMIPRPADRSPIAAEPSDPYAGKPYGPGKLVTSSVYKRAILQELREKLEELERIEGEEKEGE
jgi:transcriptional regulator with XRE-family HTH domain